MRDIHVRANRTSLPTLPAIARSRDAGRECGDRIQSEKGSLARKGADIYCNCRHTNRNASAHGRRAARATFTEKIQ